MKHIFRIIIASTLLTTSGVSTDLAAQAQDIDDRIAIVDGLAGPEAVHWDADQKIWFVSNFNGDASGDANGFVSKIDSDGALLDLEFMVGTQAYPLHGPRGMRIDGERLWVADADGLHAFDRHSGEHLEFVDFTAFDPGFLNDVELGQDGSVFLTDTGNARLFRIVDGEISIVAGEDLPAPPNGIVWNPASASLVMAPWGGARTLMEYEPVAGKLTDGLTLPDGGNMDGLEPWQGGLLIASQVDQAIWHVKDGEADVVINTPGRPADIGLDAAGGRIAVPYIALDRVDLWALPGAP